jgi:cation transport regulator ChaC
MAGGPAIHLYFAYGSNMDAATLARRLGRQSANCLRRRRALLQDHRLVFNKVSSTDPAVGYANIVRLEGQCVEGVLNELPEADLVRLDRVERVPEHYVRTLLTVYDSADARAVAAHVYTAQPAWIRPELRPLRSYVDTLLGGSDVLSQDYVTPLRAVLCRD